MRQLSVLLLALVLGVAKTAAQNQPLSPASGQVTIQRDSLLGEWGRYVIERAEHKRTAKNKTTEMKQQLLCNVCPTIVFQADSTGFFKWGDDEQGKFKWRLVGNKLLVQNTTSVPGASRILDDGEYSVVKNGMERRFVEVALVDKRRTSHILRK